MDTLWWGVLLSARMLPIVFLVPVFGGKKLPVPAKLCLSVSLAFSVWPHVAAGSPVPEGIRFLGLLLKEIAVGTVLALAASCMFDGMRMGGRLIDDLRGSSQASALVLQTDARTSPLGDLHLLLAILVFFTAGGPAILLNALIASFERVPVNAVPSIEVTSQAGKLLLALTSEAIRLGLSIAIPAAVALLMADSVLGFMNRTAPQIQVFFLGMPLRNLVGIGVVLLTLEGSMGRFLAMLTSW
jgi:flagellar biosynthesis protein FliR